MPVIVRLCPRSGRDQLDVARAKRARLRRDALPAQHVRPRYTHAEIQALGKKGLAHKKQNGEYNFPIVDRRDIIDAIHAIGRAPDGERLSVKRWIRYRAEILSLKSLVPADWLAEVHEAMHGTGRSQLLAAKARRDALKKKTCPPCKGSGRTPGGRFLCPKCGGAGLVASSGAKASSGGTAAPGGPVGAGASTGGSTPI